MVTRAELSDQKEINGASQGRYDNALADPEKQKQLQVAGECKYEESEVHTSSGPVDSSHLTDAHPIPIQPAPHLGSEERSYTLSNDSSSTFERKRSERREGRVKNEERTNARKK